MGMRYFVLLILLVLLSDLASSQAIVIRDFSSNQPVSDAYVTNERSGKVANTDAYGSAVLEDLQATDTLFVSRVGYHPDWIFPGDRKYSSVFYLHQSIVDMEAAEVVSVYGNEQSLSEVPNKVKVIGISDIKFNGSQTAADVLQSSGTVLVQKSQMGGGSPIIRGFEANKVLLVVDGVRLNNAIYRSGHIQNSITIDNNVLKQVEILFGPGSVMYGSDALGGVVHYRTRDPLLSKNKGEQHISGSLLGRISSANQEKSFHADVTVSEDNYGFLTSVTHSRFGDLEMGSRRSHGDETWGLLNYYTTQGSDGDVSVTNPDPDIQVGTAYDQLDFLQKFLWKQSEYFTLVANFQYSTSSDVPRFDRLNDEADGGPRWAEWYYGPQKRMMFSVKGTVLDSNTFFNHAHIIAAVQRIDEDRITRRFGRSTRSIQEEDVTVYSLNTDFQKTILKKVRFNYGLEFTHNDVQSSATFQDVVERTEIDAPTRYPGGGSRLTTLAAYLGFKKQLNRKFNLNLGGRYSHTILGSDFVENDFYQLPFDKIRFNNGAITGSAGLIYKPDSLWQFNVVAASAYRSPNVDDFGKVREKDGFVTVPNDVLKPEYAYSGELTGSRFLFNNKAQISATGFYTLLNDAIVQRDYQINGEDSLEVEGEVSRVQTNLNAGQAVVYGYSVSWKSEVFTDFSIDATYNFTYGQDQAEDIPLAHIPPVFGNVGVSYHTDKFRGRVHAMFNGAKNTDRYAPGSTDNPAEALENGTPSWWTLNLNTSYFVSNTIEVQFGIDNILDEHYKVFASGISAPGRNFVLSCRASF
jgi:hemoglobin/transferrin/lactoferrin receptor protein